MTSWFSRFFSILNYPNLKSRRVAPLDARGIPTHICPNCFHNMFRLVVTFDDYVIGSYETTGQCVNCDALVTVPTELDRPEEAYS